MKYKYCRYTAVQPTLFEIANHSYNFCDIVKLQSDEIPQIANFAFHGRNAVLVKNVNILSPRLFYNPQPVAKILW